MSKITTIYSCSSCGAQSLKWSGRCLECGKWGTMQTQTIDRSKKEEKTVFPAAEVIDLEKITATKEPRIKTGIGEADRVFGGGIVPGSLVIFAGEPGVGKSTIVSQIADAVAKKTPVFYVSGEESAVQVKARFERLGIRAEGLKFLNETQIEKIIAAAEKSAPGLIIVDSIQTVRTSLVESETGGLVQIRASAGSLLEFAKEKNIAVILIGHITKDGAIAGPKSLEHIVDTVIYLEAERENDYRILRAVKNRFGSVNEIGIFEMTDGGFREVLNPSGIFLESSENAAGSAVGCFQEGSRQFLVEVQALVSKTYFGYPQRKASGFDLNRLAVLSAVITKRAGVNLSNQDIILNIAGGARVQDPAADLAVSAAIISSLLNQKIGKKMLIVGEVGLAGEVRRVKNLEQKIKEAEKLGFLSAVIPDAPVKSEKIKQLKIKNLKQLVEIISGKKD